MTTIALKKSIQTPMLAPAEYWTIANVTLSRESSSGVISLKGFYNQEAFERKARHMHALRLIVAGDAYKEHIEGKTFSDIHEFLKTYEVPHVNAVDERGMPMPINGIGSVPEAGTIPFIGAQSVLEAA